MLDWEGNLTMQKDREACVVIEDLPDNEVMVSSIMVNCLENDAIDAAVVSNSDASDLPHSQYQSILSQADEVASMLADMSSILNDQRYCIRR